jgi:phosphoglycerate dehydrogenase-like enzyme
VTPSDQASLTIVIVGWHSHDQMFDEIGADLQKAGHRTVRYPLRETFAAKADALKDADVLLCVGNCPVSRRAIEAAPRLRAIVSAVTGIDGFDMAAATERGVVVANAQTEENIIGMAESTVLMIVAALYDLNDAQDRLRRSLPRPDPLRARQIRPAAPPILQDCRRCGASIWTSFFAPATSSWCWRASTRRRAAS